MAVIIYNGRDLPFDDATFDVVYSSNTLEHSHMCVISRQRYSGSGPQAQWHCCACLADFLLELLELSNADA